VLEL
jgi:predicted nuclease with TOPRIM domain